jgi:hypothetical protein
MAGVLLLAICRGAVGSLRSRKPTPKRPAAPAPAFVAALQAAVQATPFEAERFAA